MKFRFLSDLTTGVKAARDARKMGGHVEVVKELPCIRSNSFLNTVEGCTLWNCGKNVYQFADEVFRNLPAETQNRLAFSPNEGEFCERARFWKAELKSAMPSSEYYIAIRAIYRWYIHIKKN